MTTLVRERRGAFGEGALKRWSEAALGATQGHQAEVLVLARTLALTRFANNEIHQNMVVTEGNLRVRVARGSRVAGVWTNRLDPEGVAAAARQAGELARISPERPDWPGFAEPGSRLPQVDAFSAATADATPDERARHAALVCVPARAAKMRAAGFVSTMANEIAVANSRGVWAYHAGTMAETQAVVQGETGSGYADRLHRDFARLDSEGTATEVMGKARLAQDPLEVAPGTYEVVLTPYAMQDVLEFLLDHFSGLAAEEGRSFVAEQMGQRVWPEAITLVEDPLDARAFPRAFDFEGVRTEAFPLVERGVARTIVYDRQTAKRAGTRSTGHATYFAEPYPIPMHARLEPGTKTRHELVGGMKRGLIVTRLHYTNWVHPLKTIVQGMTRDGTFLVEGGEIVHPVKNLRFTQSFKDALGSVVALERELTLRRHAWFSYNFEAASIQVPAAHLAEFTFTGKTEY